MDKNVKEKILPLIIVFVALVLVAVVFVVFFIGRKDNGGGDGSGDDTEIVQVDEDEQPAEESEGGGASLSFVGEDGAIDDYDTKLAKIMEQLNMGEEEAKSLLDMLENHYDAWEIGEGE